MYQGAAGQRAEEVRPPLDAERDSGVTLVQEHSQIGVFHKFVVKGKRKSGFRGDSIADEHVKYLSNHGFLELREVTAALLNILLETRQQHVLELPKAVMLDIDH